MKSSLFCLALLGAMPSLVAGEEPKRAALDKEAIRRVARKHIREELRCYEDHALSAAQSCKRVSIELTIASSGDVTSSRVESSELGEPTIEQCLADMVRRWKFPRPGGGGSLVVTLPFRPRFVGGE